MLARARAEQPVIFPGPSGPLYGIITPAAPDSPVTGRCVVFPGRPRFRSRRLPVLWARILAADGFTCLRFDIRGHGESAGSFGSGSRKKSTGFGGEDVIAAIHHMQDTRGESRFIVFGNCYDANAALEAVKIDRGAIDGIVFAGGPVLSEKLGLPGFEQPSWTEKGRKAILSLLGRPGISNRTDFSKNFESAFGALLQSRVRALFIYCDDDRFRREFKVAEDRLFAKLDNDARQRLQVEIVPGPSSAIDSGEPRLFERAVSWIREISDADGPPRPKSKLRKHGAQVALAPRRRNKPWPRPL
ncbi:MAG TPA: alpha/beta hydrolase [Candidatus Binataceae bacterium]|nr:alpha/beta hydrolase [Candidatus Binataceae bacterium]